MFPVPPNHTFPPTFQLGVFRFHQLGANPLVTNKTAGKVGIRFEPAGVEVTFLIPKALATLDVGAFNGSAAGIVKIQAFGTTGTLLKNVLVNPTTPNTFQTVTLKTRAVIRRVVLTDGGNEGVLSKICITI
jgi:hypothetical protein